MMKVIHIFSINSGGAAIAAKRIAKSVEMVSRNNVKNEYLTLYTTEGSEEVIPFYSSSIEVFMAKIGRKVSEILLEPHSKNYPGPFTMGEYGVAYNRRLNSIFQEKDIIHIHWVNRGFFSIKQLEMLANFEIPIIWTMHDMWAFTGGCHYDGECGKYKKKCHDCICIEKGKNDFSIEQEKKKRIFTRSNFFFVGCSEWITNCAKDSYILKKQNNIECIPNPIDNDFLLQMDKSMLRDKYNVPRNEKVVLFGSMSSDDERKGGKIIHKIVSEISRRGYRTIVFGNFSSEIKRTFDNVTFFGPISDQGKMHEIYSMSDVFIAPSIQENLANTVMESLASGTPVVAFDIGGMSDMIVDGVNGKLVRPFNLEEYISSIDYIMDNQWMGQNAIESVKEKFSYKKIGARYYTLYKKATAGSE